MFKRRPTKRTESDIQYDPLDGYPDRQPYYALGFLLLRRPKPAPEAQARPELASAYDNAAEN